MPNTYYIGKKCEPNYNKVLELRKKPGIRSFLLPSEIFNDAAIPVLSWSVKNTTLEITVSLPPLQIATLRDIGYINSSSWLPRRNDTSKVRE